MRAVALAFLAALGLAPLLSRAAAADVVTFPTGGVVTSFNAGTLSSHISGIVGDGWYAYDATSVTLYYGISGEYLLFNSPVTFQSAALRNFVGTPPADAWTLTFRDLGDAVLETDTVTLTNSYQTYNFNVPNVSKITFSFASGGADQYSINQNSAWFDMANATYSPDATPAPEPASLTLLLAGTVALARVRRRR